jgi:hypothetical protein
MRSLVPTAALLERKCKGEEGVQPFVVFSGFFTELCLAAEHWHRWGASTHERRLMCSPLENPITMSMFAGLGVHVEGCEVRPRPREPAAERAHSRT